MHSLFWRYVARFEKSLVPGQRSRQQMRRVLAAAVAQGPFEVILNSARHVGMRAAFDDDLGALPRRQPAQVGEALFRHQQPRRASVWSHG